MNRRIVEAARRSAAAEASKVAGDRGGLMVSGAFVIVVVAMLSALWRAAAEANGGAVVGYSAVALVWYVTVSEIATISQRMQFIDELGDDIGSGRVDAALLRPVPMFYLVWAAQVGGMVPRLAVCTAAAVPLSLIVIGAPPSWASLCLAAPALFLGLVVNITAQHVFAAVAFWLRNSRATWFVYQKFVFVVGGMLLPLEVLPDWLETLARWLPFMAMAYVPARLAAGFFEPELLLIQLAWLVVAFISAAAVFSWGERRLTAGVS
ncbi:MAG: ABC-2 family transporter protein [Acidimicrobiales bacterium]